MWKKSWGNGACSIMFAQTIQLFICFCLCYCIHIIQGLISNKKAFSPDSHALDAFRCGIYRVVGGRVKSF